MAASLITRKEWCWTPIILVRELMAKRGYPMGDFERRAADISVDHPGHRGSLSCGAGKLPLAN